MQNAQIQGRFLNGSTMGHVVRMTMTGAVGMTFLFIVDAANLYWLARLHDPQLLAAIGYVFSIQFFSISFSVGMMIAALALVSRHIGSGDLFAARQSATAAMMLSFVTQSIVVWLIISFRFQILDLVGAKGETAQLAGRYLVISLPSVLVMAIGMIGSSILRAQGDGRRAMFVTLGGGGFALLLDPFLIYVWGFALDGAAAAMFISRLGMAFLAIYFVVRVHNLLAWPRWSGIKASALPLFKIAGPAVVTQLSMPISTFFLTKIIGDYGDDAVAVWAVVNRVTVVGFGGIFALSGAIGGIFGQNYGAKKFDRLVSTYRDAIIFAVAYSLIVWAVLLVFMPTIIHAFALPDEGVSLFRAFIIYVIGSFAVAGSIFVAISCFNSLGKPHYATALSWARDMLAVFAAIWLAKSFGAYGVVYAQAAVGALLGILAGLWGLRYVRVLLRKETTRGLTET